MNQVKTEEIIEKIVQDDSRYQREAYAFVREGLDHTQKSVDKSVREEDKHVTGQQLLAGIREYALDQYGPMAFAVLQEWGINRTDDVGEIVFNMVKCGLLRKTDKDSLDDFKGGYDFHEAFCVPFLPLRKLVKPPEEPKPAKQIG